MNTNSTLQAASGKTLEILVADDAEAVGRLVAERIASEIRAAGERGLSLCCATGATPVPAYRRLVEMHQREGLSFRSVNAFHLDEYYGLPRDHPNSFRRFMRENLFDLVDLRLEKTHYFDLELETAEMICSDYERRISAAGGIDFVVLGIGTNGHIAFNEPGTPRNSRTRRVELMEQTRRNNARFFPSLEDVPRYALTQGIANILEARGAILIATGAKKADIVRRALLEPATPLIPASYLQEYAGRLTVALDRGAAGGVLP